MPATLVGGRDRGEEERGNKEKAESPKKPPADHVRNSIHEALLLAGVFTLTAIVFAHLVPNGTQHRLSKLPKLNQPLVLLD